MADSTYQIFNCKITPERNCKVDGIKDYLDSLTAVYSGTCQYQQIKLTGYIRLPMDQSNVGTKSFNYLRLVQDSQTFYYFIIETRWISKDAVELKLLLDTINTYSPTFNAKTKINRQHKDRLVKKQLTERGFEEIVNVPVDLWQYNEGDGHYYADFNYEFNKLLDGAVITSINTFNDDTNVIDFDYIRVGTTNAFTISVEASAICSADLRFYFEFTTSIAVRNIDRVVEEDSVPLVKKEENYFHDKYNKYENVNWYIAYIGDQKPTARLYAEDRIQVGNITSATYWHEIKASDIPTGQAWYLDFGNTDSENFDEAYFNVKGQSGTAKITSDNTVNGTIVKQWNRLPGEYNDDILSGKYMLAISKTTNGKIKIRRQLYRQVGFQTSWNYSWSSDWEETNATSIFVHIDTKLDSYQIYKGAPGNSRSAIRAYTAETVLYNYDNTGVMIYGINEVDRTENTLIKIVKLPNCPVNYKVINGVYYFYGDWTLNSNDHYMSTNLDNKTFISEVICSKASPINDLVITNFHPAISDNRNDINESKLFNSAYRQNKLVFDNFNYSINLEELSLLDSDNNFIMPDNAFNLNFYTSKVFNGKFMYQLPKDLYDEELVDYPGYLIISRNNDVPLITSDYLNYMRTGYQYDQKNKALATAMDTLGVVQGTPSSWLSGAFLGRTIKGMQQVDTNQAYADLQNKGNWKKIYRDPTPAEINKAGISTGILTLAVNTLVGATKTVLSDASRQASIDSKLATLHNTACGISSNDDLDLFEIYSKNKLKVCTYEPLKNYKELVADLFYYAGYAEVVQAVPNLNTRTWFNYIECEPVFDETNQPWTEFEDDIKARYMAGLTVYHRNKIGDDYVYDWDQVKENWETSLNVI